MYSRVYIYLYLHLIFILVISVLSLVLQNTALGQDLIPVFVVFAFFWSVFSLYRNGLSLLHPYLIFLYSVFGYIVWNIFFNIIGVVVWEDLWLADQFLTDNSVIYKTNLLVLFFILFGNLGAIVFLSKNQDVSYENRTPYLHPDKIYQYRFFAKKFYFFSLPFVLLYVFYYVSAVYKYGYLVLYDPDNFYKVPAWISLADDITRVFFWVYIVTKPTLEESKKVLISYLFLTLLFLGMGTRGIVFGEFLAIAASVVYLGCNFSFRKVAVVGLFILLLSPIVGNLRVDEFDTNDSFLKSIVESQGLPLLSISAAISYEPMLPEDSYKYIYGPIVEFFSDVEYKTIDDLPRLPQVLSALLDENSFNIGWGMGNTIISEFYILGGVFGLCFLSFLYSFFLLKLFISYRSFVLMFISFISMRIIFFSVRENPTYIIVQLIYPLIIYYLFMFYMKFTIVKEK